MFAETRFMSRLVSLIAPSSVCLAVATDARAPPLSTETPAAAGWQAQRMREPASTPYEQAAAPSRFPARPR